MITQPGIPHGGSKLYRLTCQREKCGKVFWSRHPNAKYHNKACANAEFHESPEKCCCVVKMIVCTSCKISRRAFDYRHKSVSETKGVCRWCQDEAKYKKHELPTPLQVLNALSSVIGEAHYVFFLKKFKLERQQVYKLVANLVEDGYLRGIGNGRFVLGDNGEYLTKEVFCAEKIAKQSLSDDPQEDCEAVD